ncbi:MAG TPA: ABC transporter permease [Microvirga sp.]|nr:ABC transporter permease [Microvirga sp.]
MLRHAPALTLAVFLVPLGAGLVGTLLPSFGILPALGRSEFSLEPWRTLLATPGLATSLALTLRVGFTATALALVLACGFCALAAHVAFARRMERALAPLLATPHVAVAAGFAFLIAPSGWIVRLVSPELTGWDRPPTLTTVRDPAGLSLVAGLVLKEMPYLVLMMLAASGQTAARPMLAAARAMGYAPATAWAKVVLPQIYRQIRLPLYAVLAYSLSTVEVALILGPGNPPPLSVLAVRWYQAPDLALTFPAAAASVLQLLLVAAGIGIWHGGERIFQALGRRWIAAGARRGPAASVLTGAGGLAVTAGAVGYAALAGLVVWSLTAEWRYPDALPGRWSFAPWERLSGLAPALVNTLVIGIVAALIAGALALACLENEARSGRRPGAQALWLLYLPLLVPQTAFLFGTQAAFVHLGLDATRLAVVWAHLLLVLPYVFLSLADPYRALDPRYARIAAGLGSTPARAFWRVKLPILLRPVLVALAVGFAVSVDQYLPTLFAGAGRIATLTTEAVTLSSGADRRVVAVTVALQTALPLLAFAAAIALPRLLHRNRALLR